MAANWFRVISVGGQSKLQPITQIFRVTKDGTDPKLREIKQIFRVEKNSITGDPKLRLVYGSTSKIVRNPFFATFDPDHTELTDGTILTMMQKYRVNRGKFSNKYNYINYAWQPRIYTTQDSGPEVGYSVVNGLYTESSPAVISDNKLHLDQTIDGTATWPPPIIVQFGKTWARAKTADLGWAQVVVKTKPNSSYSASQNTYPADSSQDVKGYTNRHLVVREIPYALPYSDPDDIGTSPNGVMLTEDPAAIRPALDKKITAKVQLQFTTANAFRVPDYTIVYQSGGDAGVLTNAENPLGQFDPQVRWYSVEPINDGTGGYTNPGDYIVSPITQAPNGNAIAMISESGIPGEYVITLSSEYTPRLSHDVQGCYIRAVFSVYNTGTANNPIYADTGYVIQDETFQTIQEPVTYPINIVLPVVKSEYLNNAGDVVGPGTIEVTKGTWRKTWDDNPPDGSDKLTSYDYYLEVYQTAGSGGSAYSAPGGGTLVPSASQTNTTGLFNISSQYCTGQYYIAVKVKATNYGPNNSVFATTSAESFYWLWQRPTVSINVAKTPIDVDEEVAVTINVDNYPIDYTISAPDSNYTSSIDVLDPDQKTDQKVINIKYTTQGTKTVSVSTTPSADGTTSAEIVVNPTEKLPTPTFELIERYTNGYKARISNSFPANDYVISSVSGGNGQGYSAPGGGGATIDRVGSGTNEQVFLIVNNLVFDQSYTVCLYSTRVGYRPSDPGCFTSSSLPGQVLDTPTFGAITRSNNGFSVVISNWDSYPVGTTFNISGVTKGTGTINTQTKSVEVSGLALNGDKSTVCVYALASGYSQSADGCYEGSSSSYNPPVQKLDMPTFVNQVKVYSGFSVQIGNYATYPANTTFNIVSVTDPNPPFDPRGSASISGDTITVTGLNPGGESAQICVVATNSDVAYSDSDQGCYTGSSGPYSPPAQKLPTPTAGAITKTQFGFYFNISNYDATNTYNVRQPTAGSASINGSLVTVSGLAPNGTQESTVSVWAQKAQYDNSDDLVVTSTSAAPPKITTPSFSAPTKIMYGFTVVISNYDSNNSYTISSINPGEASLSGDTITVGGLSASQSAQVCVTASRSGYTTSDPGCATGQALDTYEPPAPPFFPYFPFFPPYFPYFPFFPPYFPTFLSKLATPAFGAPVKGQFSFTVVITNYDSANAYIVESVSVGSASRDGDTYTVSGLATDQESTLCIYARRTGYIDSNTACVIGQAASPYNPPAPPFFPYFPYFPPYFPFFPPYFPYFPFFPPYFPYFPPYFPYFPPYFPFFPPYFPFFPPYFPFFPPYFPTFLTPYIPPAPPFFPYFPYFPPYFPFFPPYFPYFPFFPPYFPYFPPFFPFFPYFPPFFPYFPPFFPFFPYFPPYFPFFPPFFPFFPFFPPYFPTFTGGAYIPPGGESWPQV